MNTNALIHGAIEQYGAAVGTAQTSKNHMATRIVGITTDPNKSGMATTEHNHVLSTLSLGKFIIKYA